MEEKNKRSRSPRVLKHPILKNVDYCSIVRNKKSILEIDGKELQNKSWREFQIFLGERIPAGKCFFTIKFKNESELYTGQIRAINMDKPNSDSDLGEVSKLFKNLESKLNSAQQSGGITFDMLLASTKQGYEANINFLNQQILFKDGIITDLKNDISELDKDLTECEKENRKIQESTGWMSVFDKYKPMIEAGLMKLGAKQVPAASLAAVNPGDIPEEVLQILAQVDYVALKQQPEKYQQILTYLRQYISVLPLKVQQ